VTVFPGLVAAVAASLLALVGGATPKPAALSCPSASVVSAVVGGPSTFNAYGPFTQKSTSELSCTYAGVEVEYVSGISASLFNATHESLPQYTVSAAELTPQLLATGYWETDYISVQTTETWLAVLNGTTEIEVGGDNVTNADAEALLAKVLSG